LELDKDEPGNDRKLVFFKSLRDDIDPSEQLCMCTVDQFRSNAMAWVNGCGICKGRWPRQEQLLGLEDNEQISGWAYTEFRSCILGSASAVTKVFRDEFREAAIDRQQRGLVHALIEQAAMAGLVHGVQLARRASSRFSHYDLLDLTQGAAQVAMNKTIRWTLPRQKQPIRPPLPYKFPTGTKMGTLLEMQRNNKRQRTAAATADADAAAAQQDTSTPPATQPAQD
jgi:hypothetical protein